MRPGWIAVASAVTICAAPAAASAYCLAKVNANKPYVAWTTQPVTYRISDTVTDAKIIAAIDAAFAAWGSVTCSKLKFTKGASFKLCNTNPCAAGTVAFQHQNPELYVHWHTAAWSEFVNPSDPKMPYASYTYFNQNNTGGIVGASIAVNAKDYTFADTLPTTCTSTFDVRNFMMPAIGGVIGLTDSKTAGSVMYPDFKFCSTAKQNLTQDDKDGVVQQYYDGSCAKPPAVGADGCLGSVTPPAGDGPKTEAGVTPPKDLGPRSEKGVTPGYEAGGSYPEAGAAVQCNKNEECGAGAVCTVDHRCEKVDSGGCCRVSHAEGGVSQLYLGLLGVLGFLALRRRRGR